LVDAHTAIQAASGKAEEEPIPGLLGDDDDAAGRRLGVVGAAEDPSDAP
jgi:hypothetical protein